MASVTLNNVDKYYGKTCALSNVSLEIDDGEFVVFVGPSGCGKSTLLRAIAGLESIGAGSIEIDHLDVTRVAPSERDVAMVFQTYALYPHMSVYANMEFGMKVNGVAPGQRKERVLEAARVLQLEDYLQRKPGQLSGGQRQRVAIGRAIVKKPKVFLFDEPLSNLDAKLRVKMRIELEALHQQLKSTMIYVTHDQVEAMTMADKIVVLNNGVVEQVGAPLDLYHHPRTEFVADFLGSPGMNLFDVTTRDNAVYLGDDLLTEYNHSDPLSKMGIRPEHVTIASADEGQLQVTITVKETLGGEAYLYTKHEPSNTAFVVKTDGDDNHQANDIISLRLPAARMHFFNQSGIAVKKPS